MERSNRTQLAYSAPSVAQTEKSTAQAITNNLTHSDTNPAVTEGGLTVVTPQVNNATTPEWHGSYDSTNAVNTSLFNDISDVNASVGEINSPESHHGTFEAKFNGSEELLSRNFVNDSSVRETLVTPDVRRNLTTAYDSSEGVSTLVDDISNQVTTEQTLTEAYERTAEFLDTLNGTSVHGNITNTLGNNTSDLGNKSTLFGYNTYDFDRNTSFLSNASVFEDTTSALINETSEDFRESGYFDQSLVTLDDIFENETLAPTSASVTENFTTSLESDTSVFDNETSFDYGLPDAITNVTDHLYNSTDLSRITDSVDYDTGSWNVSTDTLASSSWELLENVTATVSTILGNVTETDLINTSLIEDDSFSVTYDWLDLNQSDVDRVQPHYVYSLQYYLGEMIVVTILLGILTLWTIIGNLLVLISLIKFKNLKTMSNYLIGNLAFCDFLLALTVLPLSLINDVLGHWLFGEVLCNIWLSIDVLYCTASIWSLCVIALDRFTATTFPVWYRDKRSLNRAMCYTSIVWIFSIIVTVPPLFGWQDRSMNYQYSNITTTYHCILFQNVEYVIYSALGSFIIPLFLMLVLYMKIFTVLRKRSKQLNRAYQRNHQQRRVPSKKVNKVNVDRNRLPPQDIELSTISKGEDSKFLFSYSTDSSPDPDLKSDYDEDILSSPDVSNVNSPSYLSERDHPGVSLIRPELRNGLLSATEATDSDTMVISNPSRFTDITDKESSDQEKVKLVQAQHDEKNQDSQDAKQEGTDNGHHKKSGGLKSPNPFKRERLRSSFRKFDKREQRATKRMGMIISCFVVCWMPFTLMYLIRALCAECPELNPNLQAFIIWLGYANSGLNPILYTIFNEDFRRAFIKLVCCCWPWAMKFTKGR